MFIKYGNKLLLGISKFLYYLHILSLISDCKPSDTRICFNYYFYFLEHTPQIIIFYRRNTQIKKKLLIGRKIE